MIIWGIVAGAICVLANVLYVARLPSAGVPPQDLRSVLSAVAIGNDMEVERLLTLHPNLDLTWRPDSNDTSWEPVLLQAVSGPSPTVLKKLIDRGLNPNEADVNGRTALHKAAFLGKDAMVQALLNSGADVNARDFDGGHTPLMRAARGRNLRTVRLLLEAGANPLIKSQKGTTARLNNMDPRYPNPEIENLLRDYEQRWMLRGR